MEERKKVVYDRISKEVYNRGNKVKFVSYSALEKFLKCKRCYKYQYIDKHKVEYMENLHADVGVLCHDLIEWTSTEGWSREKIKKTFKERITKICNKFSMQQDLPVIKSVEHFFDTTEYMNRIYEEGLKVAFEVPVYRRINYEEEPNTEYWLVGFIDMVIENSDGKISIIDFKTSNISGYTGKRREQAFLQIYSYAYLYEALYRKRVVNVGYLFIKYCDITFLDDKGRKRKSSKVERRNIQEEFLSKNGKSDLIISDCLELYEYNKDNRLVYIKRLIDIFNDTKKEELFEGSNRDKHFCNNFCPFRCSEVCDWKDKQEENNLMMDIMKSLL